MASDATNSVGEIQFETTYPFWRCEGGDGYRLRSKCGRGWKTAVDQRFAQRVGVIECEWDPAVPMDPLCASI